MTGFLWAGILMIWYSVPIKICNQRAAIHGYAWFIRTEVLSVGYAVPIPVAIRRRWTAIRAGSRFLRAGIHPVGNPITIFIRTSIGGWESG
jgi:hypothetical protein